MKQWLFSVAALDETDVAVTLRFSDSGYIDMDGNYYEPRILTPALVYTGASDGGLFPVFNHSSVGDIDLANKDGALYGLADYALDGRLAVISFVDDAGGVTDYFTGTISTFSESNGVITFSLTSRQDALTDDVPLAVYAGDNVGAVGLEGTDDDIGGDYNPKVLGACLSITPKLVNASLLIYQVSDRADCRVTAVYDDGLRLVNYRADGVHAVDATSIAFTGRLGAIADNKHIMFANHATIYIVITGAAPGGSLVLSSPLTVAVPDRTAIDVLDFYADTAVLQTTDFHLSADAVASDVNISVAGGTGTISAGDWVVFDNHAAIYEVGTGLVSGVIILVNSLTANVPNGAYVQVIGANQPPLWGAYQGFFRLTMMPVGTVTCDAVSIDGSNAIHRAGDVCKEVATLAGLTMGSASVTALNAAGIVRLLINDKTTVKDLFDRLIKSVAGYYYFFGATLYADLLPVPAVSAVFTIEDWQIKSLVRVAIGMGGNGWPIKSVNAHYDKLETVQTAFAGRLSAARKERLGKPFRDLITPAATVRHLLAEPLELASLLASKPAITAVANRVLAIAAVARHVVDIEAFFDDIPAFQIGDTVELITPRWGYPAGRLVVIIGYLVDAKRGLLTFRCYG